MTSMELSTIVAFSLSIGTQALKDHMRIPGQALRYGVPLIGLTTALGLSLTDGDKNLVTGLINAAIGGLLPAGIHSVGFKDDSLLGRIVKSFGGAIFSGNPEKKD